MTNSVIKAENLRRILPGNRVYDAAARREAKAWGTHFVLKERRSVEYAYPPIAAYRNELITGNPAVTWLEFIRNTFGKRSSALSVGVGTGWIEQELLKMDLVGSLEIMDLSKSALDEAIRRTQAVGRAIDVSAFVGDCNFIELQPERYDLIVCHSILHHVINLEHVLHQLNAALKVGGVLVVDEYVGPSRWQWPRETCSFVNAIMTQLSDAAIGERKLLSGAELVQRGVSS